MTATQDMEAGAQSCHCPAGHSEMVTELLRHALKESD